MNKQAIFDKVVKRLGDGTGRALDSYGHCAYDNGNGLRCAVGIFIPDEHEALNSGGNVIMITMEFGDLPDFIEANIPLMSALQDIHDCGNNWDYSGLKPSQEMNDNLESVASDFDLQFTPFEISE